MRSIQPASRVDQQILNLLIVVSSPVSLLIILGPNILLITLFLNPSCDRRSTIKGKAIPVTGRGGP
jgi:hypothetical protein